MKKPVLYSLTFLTIALHFLMLFTFWQALGSLSAKIFHLSPIQIYSSLKSPDFPFLVSDNQRTNILIIGNGGTNHSGGELSDTLILASIPHNRQPISLIAIPRDLWIPDLGAKINASYEQGESKQVGFGIVRTRQSVSQVTNMPVHYYLNVDFEGFSQLIDALGGIDVQVLNSFTDDRYPIPGLEEAQPEESRYESISFSQGKTQMDGSLALKFVRSRNANGVEGTDLARSARQEQVIRAIIAKVLSPATWQDRNKINNIISIVQNNLHTDITPNLYIDFFKLSLRNYPPQISTITIPSYVGEGVSSFTQDEALLIHPGISSTYGNQWVLTPKSGDFPTIHEYLNCQVNSSNCSQ